MSDTLFGGVESGTPLETRAGAEDMASFMQSLLSGDTSRLGSFQRLGAQSFSNLFGVSPGTAGTSDVITSMLADPESQTRGLFASLRPFEQRATGEAVSGVRGMFGTAGGRFSRNVADAESRTRGELAGQFARTREEALLGAQQQRGNFLATLFGLANQNAQTSMMPIQMAAQYLQPGAPIYKEGLLPGLLAAGANIFAASKFGGLGGRGGADAAPGPGGGGWGPMGPPPMPSGPGQMSFDPNMLRYNRY